MEAPTPESAPKEERLICANCEKKMARKGKFCPHCGQRHFDGRIRMRDVLARFLHNLIHVDNKFVKMVWHLLIPGEVTIQYFKGKIRRYPHPVQFFFVVMFFFLLLFNKALDAKQHTSEMQAAEIEKTIADSTANHITIKKSAKPNSLFESFKAYITGQKIKAAYDSLPANLRTQETRMAIDSAVAAVLPVQRTTFDLINFDDGDSTTDASLNDSLRLNILNIHHKIALADLVDLEPDEIIQKYEIQGWQNRMLVKQGLKSIKNPEGLKHNYIGSLTWTILALVALMAGLLRILYWRQKRYYAEHFIFLLHQHSGGFLILTLGLLIHEFYHFSKGIWVLLNLWIAFALLVAMYRYYRQGLVKTTVKWFIYGFCYLICFMVLFLMGMGVVFAIY